MSRFLAEDRFLDARPAVPSPIPVAAEPWFTLVLATVGRDQEVEAFLGSLAAQRYRRFDVVLVDQNDDERLRPLVQAFRREIPIEWIRSEPGLSRARNAGLPFCRGDIIAFPDDDCMYPADLLLSVAAVFAGDSSAGGVSVLPCDATGRPFPRFHREEGWLAPSNILHRCSSISLFLRTDVVTRTGGFNEKLGLGAGTLWGSGEDIDFPLRALKDGHRIRYRPDITVTHNFEIDCSPAIAAERGYSYGAGLGWLLRRHRFPVLVTLQYIFIRPLGGMLLGAARGRWSEARFYAAAIRGRCTGWISA